MLRFDFLNARNLRHAISLLERHGDEARAVAGSTDFLVRWRQSGPGRWRPAFVVNIKGLSGLGRITYSPQNGLRLGALATVQAIETNAQVRRRYQALATGATSFAGVQVRNLATVGGNVCNASPAGDTLPALLAFDAQCAIVGPEGPRMLPLTEFFQGPGRTALQQGELLTQLTLPPPTPRTGSIYIKHSPRGAMDIATVGVASVITLEEDGATCKDARIALGAVGPVPFRASEAENLLKGRELSPDALGQAAEAARNAATPIDDVRGTAAYRKDMVEALTRRTLQHALRIAGGQRVPFEEQRRLAVQTAF
ncbi:MAG: xanthine dehydrogenase family protein subunit M [Chloroflexota bacterium]|nr:xanthine dehydrogenase family protein subunit M [Chloroflexota bacterium]